MNKDKNYMLFVLLFCSLAVYSQSPFAVIMYDTKTETKYGSFPPNRSVWASTIDKAKECNAKAIVLKFFFDLPTDYDAVLASSIKTIPTFLQACINDNDPSSNQLDKRFEFRPDKQYKHIITGNKGWLPLDRFSTNAYEVGFVDYRNVNNIPILERYSDVYVKSLSFCILQYVLPGLQLENNALKFNNTVIKLNKFSEMHVKYPKEDSLEYIPLCDVLNDSFDKDLLAGKVVIIGWDGDASETFEVSTGKVKIHRVFIYGLYDMYNQLIKKESD